MLAGKPIVLFRDNTGAVVALEDRCVHRHAPLSLGKVESQGLRCRYHGLLFAPDGKCLHIPGQTFIPPNAFVTTYPVLERHGWIWVWPGDPRRASETVPPTAIAGDHPDWITAQSHLDFDASHRLLIENLLDFSHLSYVHEKSFRADPKWAIVRPSIKSIPNGLRISRWIVEAPALRSARAVAGKIVDTWQSYDFVVPGILTMETLYCAPGTAQKSEFDRPESDIWVRNCAAQAVTALTSRRTRYFFAVALPAGDADQATCESILAISQQAFLEDKLIIEAQQQRADQAPERAALPISSDGAIARFNGILHRVANIEASEIYA
jgi:vanillate O-demethylase monooxygenase subunit